MIFMYIPTRMCMTPDGLFAGMDWTKSQLKKWYGFCAKF